MNSIQELKDAFQAEMNLKPPGERIPLIASPKHLFSKILIQMHTLSRDTTYEDVSNRDIEISRSLVILKLSLQTRLEMVKTSAKREKELRLEFQYEFQTEMIPYLIRNLEAALEVLKTGTYSRSSYSENIEEFRIRSISPVSIDLLQGYKDVLVDLRNHSETNLENVIQRLDEYSILARKSEFIQRLGELSVVGIDSALEVLKTTLSTQSVVRRI